jgi:hypothetical protein
MNFPSWYASGVISSSSSGQDEYTTNVVLPTCVPGSSAHPAQRVQTPTATLFLVGRLLQVIDRTLIHTRPHGFRLSVLLQMVIREDIRPGRMHEALYEERECRKAHC